MPVTLHAAAADQLSYEEIEHWRNVPVAVAVDVGKGQGQIDPAIRPLRAAGQQPRLFGRALTARCVPPDFGAVLWAVERIRAGDVLVIAAGGDAGTAMIGEILSGQLRRQGSVGLVCDGAIRDVGTLAIWPDFPVFTRHVTPRGPISAGQGSVGEPVTVGGCLIQPGDLIIGDDDGLVALGPDAVRAWIADAQAKLRLEAEWEASLASGQSIARTFKLDDPAEAP